MKTIGLIPARAGSERLPGKNTIYLGGRPLIAWTIEAAKAAYVIDEVYVSTDSDHIASVSESFGSRVIKRPPHLAGPEIEMLPVVQHATNLIQDAEIIVLLQPTSPLRTAEDICAAYTLFKERGGDAVVSVTDVIEDMAFEIGHAMRMRPSRGVVIPNGAIYLITREHLKGGGTWYNGLSYAYKMPKERSVDIDTKLDLDIARVIIQSQLAA